MRNFRRKALAIADKLHEVDKHDAEWQQHAEHGHWIHVLVVEPYESESHIIDEPTIRKEPTHHLVLLVRAFDSRVHHQIVLAVLVLLADGCGWMQVHANDS